MSRESESGLAVVVSLYKESSLAALVENELATWRWKRAQVLGEKVKDELELMRAEGREVVAPPPGFLLEAWKGGSMEEDEDLQKMWAKLIASAADAETSARVKRSYISVLEALDPLDARVLGWIAKHSKQQVATIESPHYPVFQGNVRVRVGNLERIVTGKIGETALMSELIARRLSLENLERQKLIVLQEDAQSTTHTAITRRRMLDADQALADERFAYYEMSFLTRLTEFGWSLLDTAQVADVSDIQFLEWRPGVIDLRGPHQSELI